MNSVIQGDCFEVLKTFEEGLKIEEHPPFSANPEIREKAEMINKYLIPPIKEKLLASIKKDEN